MPSFFLNAETIVTIRSPEVSEDKRELYNRELITLALEKTKNEYGTYRIEEMPSMNIARTIYSLKMDLYTNILVELSYQESLQKELYLDFIDFPLDLGIVGYRVCFISPHAKEIISQGVDLKKIKEMTIAQGVAWADTEILRYNGFNVVEINNYPSIFNMVASNRVDLFCRGANEIADENESFKHINNLSYDDSFILFYPLPRFYYLNSKNLLIKERISKGLRLAYHDGSLIDLWLRHYSEKVALINLKKRKLFILENPFIESLSEDYTIYFYNPLTNAEP